MTDIQAWIPCNIPASGGRPAVTSLRVLVTQQGERLWQANSLDRRIVVSNGTALTAYWDLFTAFGARLQADRAREQKILQKPEDKRTRYDLAFRVLGNLRSASISSHQRFEEATGQLSMSVPIRASGRRRHALVYLLEDGWHGLTLEDWEEEWLVGKKPKPHNPNPSAAFAALGRVIQELSNMHADRSAVVTPAPRKFWEMCQAPGHESFGHGIPVLGT